MKKNGMRPIPPGEILKEEFLKPLGLTANALAKAIGVPRQSDYGDSEGSKRHHGGHRNPAGNVFQNARRNSG